MNQNGGSPNGASNDNSNDRNAKKNEETQICEFIEACNLLNDANNENRARGDKYLQEFKRRASPYDICLRILSSTSEAHVQFQALRTICDSFLTEWSALSIDYVDVLRNKLLLFPVDYTQHNAGKFLSGFVLNEIAKCVSVMFKRKWRMDDDEFNRRQICDVILRDIEKLVSSNDPSIAVIGLIFCAELIEEFSVNHASSALGLTWDFHIKCHRGFERFCLQNLFILVCKLFSKILHDMITMDGVEYAINPSSKILTAIGIEESSHGNVVGQSVVCMVNMTAMVIEKCLAFNFHEKTSDDKLLLVFARNVQLLHGNNELLRPGPAWKACLIDCNLLKLLNIWHEVLYEHKQQFSATLRILRQSIISLHSLSGHIFDTLIDDGSAISDDESDDDDDEDRSRRVQFKLDYSKHRLKGMELVLNRIPFVRSCLMCLSKYMWTLQNKKEELDCELVTDICRMLQTLCHNFRYELLIQMDEFSAYLMDEVRQLSDLLIPCLPRVWANEAFDILMQGITCLINCYEIRKHALKKKHNKIVQILSAMTQSIFTRFVDQMMSTSSSNEEEEEEEQYRDEDYLNERLIGMAMIGRINARHVLPYLSSKIEAILTQFAQFRVDFVAHNHRMPSEQQLILHTMHEELFWLFQFLGYTLADDPRREQTKIPNILIANDDDQMLVRAIYPMFEWIKLENECITSNKKQLLSPLLGKTVILMLSRWCSCYLMPNVAYYEHISLGLLKSFGSCGSQSNGIAILDMCIYKCCCNIFQWREEREVVAETCLLLEQFVKHSSIRPYLFKSTSFNAEILNKYFDGSLQLHLLRPPHLISTFIRIILQSVIGGHEDVADKSSAFERITQPIYASFVDACRPLCESHSFHTSEQVNRLEISIYKLHGIAQTQSHFTFDFMLRKGIFEILIGLIAKLRNNFDNNVVLMMFKIFADISETSLLDLDRAQSKRFLLQCVRLMQEFCAHNVHRMALQDNEFIDVETKEKYEQMQCEEIIVILKLLEFMSTKDLIDVNLSPTAHNDNVYGECIFKSFYYLTPCVQSQLLQYSVVTKRFYEVLSICIRGFTATFATKLNNEQRNTILGNKIFESLQSAQYEICEYGLEIIQCFAEYDLEKQQSPFVVYLQQSIHSLMMLAIDIKTPKLLYPKLCETLLPVLIACGKQNVAQYLTMFIKNIATQQAQKDKLATIFNQLMHKIHQLKGIGTANFVINLKTKTQFRDYFIGLTHQIRTIVSVH